MPEPPKNADGPGQEPRAVAKISRHHAADQAEDSAPARHPADLRRWLARADPALRRALRDLPPSGEVDELRTSVALARIALRRHEAHAALTELGCARDRT